LRNDFGAGLANPSELGGFDEFFDVCPSRASSSATRTRIRASSQLVALREPLKKPLNRRRSRHRKIINPVDAKIKLTRRERGPDQLRLLFSSFCSFL
jgi:hypothetical protein